MFLRREQSVYMTARAELGAHTARIQEERGEGDGDVGEEASETDLLVPIRVASPSLSSTEYPAPVAALQTYGAIVEEVPLGPRRNAQIVASAAGKKGKGRARRAFCVVLWWETDAVGVGQKGAARGGIQLRICLL